MMMMKKQIKLESNLLEQAVAKRRVRSTKRKQGCKGRAQPRLPVRRQRVTLTSKVNIANITEEQMQIIAADYVKDFSASACAARCNILPGTMRKLRGMAEFKAMVQAVAPAVVTEKVMEAQEVLLEMSRLGRVNMEDYIEFNERGDAVINLSQCSRAQLAGVSEYQVEEHYEEGEDDDSKPVLVRKPRIKLTGHKLEALKLLAQYHKVIGLPVSGAGLPGSAAGMVPPVLNITFSNEKAS